MAQETGLPAWPGWKTVCLLGRGSYGAVYKIERDVFGDVEQCAMKHIAIPHDESEVREMKSEGMDSAGITRSFSEQARDIVSEYKLMMKLNDCPNVVRCYDVQFVQRDDGYGWNIYIRMELLKPLMDLLSEERSWPEEKIIRLGKDIAKALVYCQRHNIIHRDIKPQNIMVSEAGEYKLGDFGIARIASRTGSATARIGTFTYMAPEVYNGLSYDARADIYSLGMVLYWLLNGRRAPFVTVNTQSEKEAAQRRRFGGEAVPAPAHGSEGLKRIVLKACAFEPKARYQTAEELLADLDALEGAGQSEELPTGQPGLTDYPEDPGLTEYPDDPGLTERADDPGLTERADDPGLTEPVSRPPTHREPARPPEKKKTGPVLLGVLAALIALAAVGWFTIHSWSAASCTQPETCKICGRTRGEALSHSWSEWETLTAATCTTAGEEQRVCANDPAHVETRKIPAAGHVWQEATCTTPSVCTVCGKQSDGPIGHAWSEATYEWAPDNGSVTAMRSCARCGETETETVETTVKVTRAATAYKKGEATYTAAFRSGAFRTQTKTVAVWPVWEGNGLSCELADTKLTILGVGTVKALDTIIPDWESVREKIETIEIGHGVTEIGDYAFFGCRSLTSVTIPEGVSNIDSYVFYGCNRLTIITIPNSITDMGGYAFSRCTDLKTIDYAGTKAQWDKISLGIDTIPVGVKINYLG